MRNLDLLIYRDAASELKLYGQRGDHENGCFVVGLLRVIASAGEGWEHVSVARTDRCPIWDEMDRIKRLFFKDDETVMQLHVPATEHINCHPHCLHLWRPIYGKIPRPPSWMVGK